VKFFLASEVRYFGRALPGGTLIIFGPLAQQVNQLRNIDRNSLRYGD
jgi:hypothetical protein